MCRAPMRWRKTNNGRRPTGSNNGNINIHLPLHLIGWGRVKSKAKQNLALCLPAHEPWRQRNFHCAGQSKAIGRNYNKRVDFNQCQS